MTKLIISLFITIFLIYDGNCGIISWFKSIGKPIWYSKIDQPPLIEIFHPKGLRVSIADIDGLELFKFHANLNSDPIMLEKLITQKSNGRWWYINEDIVMNIDDKLKYWIYVKVNNEELLFSQQTYKVKNLIPMPSSLIISDDIPASNVEWSNSTVEKLCPCTDRTSEISPDRVELSKNEYTILNRAIIEQSSELESVYRLIHEEMKNNTKLLFVDNKRSTSDIKFSEIKLILEEKLNLKILHQISLVDTTPCGILLDIFSAIQKMEILIAGSKFLKNTSQKFLEPSESDCLYENNYFIQKVN